MATTYGFTTLGLVRLLTATATDYTVVRAVFSDAMKRSDPLATDDASNPANYVFVGGFRVIHAKEVTIINSTTFDLTVDEMQDGAQYTLSVRTSMVDESGTVTIESSLVTDPDADNAVFIGLGEHPRIVSVSNLAAGLIQVDFSEAMFIGPRLKAPDSYTVTGIGSVTPLLVESVITDEALPTRVTLKFIGGGSCYTFSAIGVIDLAGNPVLPGDTFSFCVGLPGIDELFTQDKTYFETDLGAIQLGISNLSQRRIEDLVIMRAQALGFREQLSIISDALANSGVNRDDQKLNLFKG